MMKLITLNQRELNEAWEKEYEEHQRALAAACSGRYVFSHPSSQAGPPSSTILKVPPSVKALIDSLPPDLKAAMHHYRKAHEGYFHEEDDYLVSRIAHGIQYSDDLADKACDEDFTCLDSLPDDIKREIIVYFKSFSDGCSSDSEINDL